MSSVFAVTNDYPKFTKVSRLNSNNSISIAMRSHQGSDIDNPVGKASFH
jgi:hypothetical protein